MIGNKIKNIRELKNFTQGYMAEKMDISQAAYSKLEKGNVKISPEKLAEIAKILEVNPEDITAFDSQKYLNSFNNLKGNNNGVVNITYDKDIKKLYEDKISLLEKMLLKTENELEEYKVKYSKEI